MSDAFRIVEYLGTPSPLFCVYDYTKIAYLTDHYLCFREVVAPDVPPAFIRLERARTDHPVEERYFGIVAYPNMAILAEKTVTRDIYLHFYQMNDRSQVKIMSELAKRAQSGSELRFQMHSSSGFIYLIVHRGSDTEIIAVSVIKREVIGRGFMLSDLQDFKLKGIDQVEMFSCLQPETNEIVEYQLLNPKSQDVSKIVEKRRWPLPKGAAFGWCKDELVLFDPATNRVVVTLEGRETQAIEGIKNVRMLVPLGGGFMVFFTNTVRLYRKSANFYDLQGQYRFSDSPNPSIQFSPQEDMITFYNAKAKAICWTFNWQSSEKSSKLQGVEFNKIQVIKEELVKAFESHQALFAVSSGSIIKVYSPISYQPYLSLRASVRDAKLAENRRLLRANTLVPEKMLNEMSEGESIETMGMHPTRPILGVAFKNIVRIYLVLYSDFKVIKELNLSHCKEIGFSNGGSIMHAKLGGKQGSKIYLYNILNNFEYIEVLNTNRPILSIVWNAFDTTIYAVHELGYYNWSVQSQFKQRNDSSFTFEFSIKGVASDARGIILWGSRELIEMDWFNNVLNHVQLHVDIDNLLLQRGQIIFTAASGDLYRCKNLAAMEGALVGQSFRLGEGNRLFGVRNNTVLCLNGNGNILCLEWGVEENSLEVVSVERKKLRKFQAAYKEYEENIQDINEKMEYRLEIFRQEFSEQSRRQREEFGNELRDRQQRYFEIREEKIKLQEQIQESMEKNEEDMLKQIRELEKIYERKMALTTNKLLTSEEMAFRNNSIARQNLMELEERHADGIHKVRGQYSKALQNEIKHGKGSKDDVLALKKHYETRLAEVEMENEELLKKFQNANQNSIINLKKNIVNWELKYTEAVSQKFNLEKNFDSQRILMEQLRAKNDYLSQRLEEELRRGQQQIKQNGNLQSQLIERDEVISCLEARINELEKSNEIFKYRIVEIKSITDPKEEEILKMKDNMIELEDEFEKISKKAHEHEQTIALLKKDNSLIKNSLASTSCREKKVDKSYGDLVEKLRQLSKTPIQDIRKSLMKLLEECERTSCVKNSSSQKYKDSPIDELNRVRQHLEVCLKQAVEAGKRNENQKDAQVKRKNHENSELLKEINDLRLKVNDLESRLKEKQRVLQDVKRDRRTSGSLTKGGRDHSTTQVESTEYERRQSKESFFEKSLFRGHWKDKRLKTEQGSRKKSHNSYGKNDSNNLYIEPRSENVEELKRLLDQKELIIKQLINKIHKLS